MNSTSTYLRAKLGGFHGRALITGDQVMFHSPREHSLKMMQHLNLRVGHQAFARMDWSIALDLIPY